MTIGTIILIVVFLTAIMTAFSRLSTRIDNLSEKLNKLKRDFDIFENNYDARYHKMCDIISELKESIKNREKIIVKNETEQITKDISSIRHGKHVGYETPKYNKHFYPSSNPYNDNYFLFQSYNHDNDTSSHHSHYGSGSSGGGGCSDSWGDSSSSCDCSSSD